MVRLIKRIAIVLLTTVQVAGMVIAGAGALVTISCQMAVDALSRDSSHGNV